MKAFCKILDEDEVHQLTDQLMKNSSSVVLFVNEDRDLIQVETLTGRLLFSAAKIKAGWHILVRDTLNFLGENNEQLDS